MRTPPIGQAQSSPKRPACFASSCCWHEARNQRRPSLPARSSQHIRRALMWTRCVAWRLNRSVAALGAVLGYLPALGCSDDSHLLGSAAQAAPVRGEPRVIGLCSNGADLELLDPMEDGDGAIEMIAQRGGVWFSFNDETEGSQLPEYDDETFVMSELVPPRSDSHY